MPDSPRISLVPTDAADVVREAVDSGLLAFNRVHAGDAHRAPLVLAATGSQGQVVGGLIGEIAWRWLFIDRLWVEEAHRGRGAGRELVQRAEAEALRRDCIGVYLDTYDFQARPFYERLGYTLFGELQDYPPGHRRLFLQKRLEPSNRQATERGS